MLATFSLHVFLCLSLCLIVCLSVLLSVCLTVWQYVFECKETCETLMWTEWNLLKVSEKNVYEMAFLKSQVSSGGWFESWYIHIYLSN